MKRRSRNIRAVAALAVLVSLPTRGLAECIVQPGAEGEIGTWLTRDAVAMPSSGTPLVPVDQQLTTRLAALPAGGRHPDATWTPRAGHEARFDTEGDLRGRGPRTVTTGAVLEASEAVTVQLFLGTDDGVAVLLDGQEIYRRAVVRDAYDDDDRVPLALTPGRHDLVFVQFVRGGAVRLIARLVGGDFRPDARVRVVLPGVDDVTCGLLAQRALAVDPHVAVTAQGVRVEIDLAWPGGAPSLALRQRDRSVTMTSGTATVSTAVPLAGAHLTLDLPDAARAFTLVGDLGAPRTFTLHAPSMARVALRRAARVLAPLDETTPPSWLPRGSLLSTRGTAERLARLIDEGDDDVSHLTDEAALLNTLLDAIDARHDPYAGRRGPLRRAYRSSVDGSLQEYSIYVPGAYRGDRPFPAVVALHGLAGTAHRMLPILFGLYDEHESRTHADRHLPPLPDTEALLVAPFGFGDAGYRALGETDVMEVLADVQQNYRVDLDRTYMTGLSMGGIGAAAIPLHHPDVFAAAAPLCGYHSYFVRGDTQTTRQSWEPFLMEARSNATWAENGLHLPLYVVHGTLDRPVANSRVLVDRYTELHYRVESEWPELPHNVWSTTYAGGRIVPYFLRFRRDPMPRHVRFRTANVRWNRDAWVQVDRLASHGAWGDVDATADREGVRMEVHGIAALTLSPAATLFAPGVRAVPVHLEHDTLSLALGHPVSLVRGADGHWSQGAMPALDPVGPVRDVFDQPVAVVYGTQRPEERAMNERVARAWARMKPGIHVAFPVLADTALTDAFAATHALVLVGTTESNAWIARFAPQLPIVVHDGTIRYGAQQFTGAELGATFTAVNPLAPTRPLVVITGTSALGVWRSRFLPDLLPDYMIYDASIAPARGEVLVGAHARALAAGYFATAP